MRYYNLTITDPQNGAIWGPTSDGRLVKGPAPNAPTSGGVTTTGGISTVTVTAAAPFSPKYTFTSHPNGLQQPPDPGAPNIEFEVIGAPAHQFQGVGNIRVRGVGLRMIGQAANLNGQKFTLSAGMGKGLPLAKPAQASEIIRGKIARAYGNWEGVEQTLELVLWNDDTAPTTGAGILFEWNTGQTLANAITTTLKQAFPSFTPVVQALSPVLQSVPDGCYQAHTAATLQEFAKYIQELTLHVGRTQTQNQNYAGVWIFLDGNNIRIADGTQNPLPKAIAFEDIIGQPTWINATQISFATTLRADINVIDSITLPTTVAAPYAITSSAAAVPNAPAQSSLVFKGAFILAEVHHYANFRATGAENWNTTFVASPISVSTGSANLLNASAGL